MTEATSVKNFREFLRINTSHPNPDYPTAMAFLKRMAEELGLPYEEFDVLLFILDIRYIIYQRHMHIYSYTLSSHVYLYYHIARSW